MKKISLFALALSTSVALFAQDNVNRRPMPVKTYFGIKGGVNLAKLRPSDFGPGEVSTNLKTTAHAGFLVRIPLSTTGGFAVQPELVYNRQGSKMKTTTTVGSISSTTPYEQDLGYLSVPIMLQWKSAGGFYVETGPQGSFLLDARQEGPGDDNEIENEGDMEKFDFSWGAGLGYMSRMGLGIGARYNHGFTNVLEENSANPDARLRNSVVQIGLTWLFGANK
jgi:hypothetical protein